MAVNEGDYKLRWPTALARLATRHSASSIQHFSLELCLLSSGPAELLLNADYWIAEQALLNK
jgi:hypothetical protein